MEAYVYLDSMNLISSNYCVWCLPEKVYAQIIFNGNSCCLKCYERKK